jgi:hypothetical protein
MAELVDGDGDDKTGDKRQGRSSVDGASSSMQLLVFNVHLTVRAGERFFGHRQPMERSLLPDQTTRQTASHIQDVKKAPGSTQQSQRRRSILPGATGS